MRVLALLYGIVAARQVFAAPTGNPRMVEIAAAIQEGANAYLNRQYRTIGIVGIFVAAFLTWMLGVHVGLGFRDRCYSVRSCGLYWYECLCTRQCAYCRSGT